MAMASGLQRALAWRWSPFFALAAAAGIFAVGVASLLPDPVDHDAEDSGRAAASLRSSPPSTAHDPGEPGVLDELDEPDEPDERAERERERAGKERERATQLREKAREARIARRKKAREARERADNDSPEGRPVSFTRPAHKEPDEGDEPEESDEPPERTREIGRTFGAKLAPSALKNTQLLRKLEAEESEDDSESGKADSDAEEE